MFDINEMFADAVKASEDTGENNDKLLKDGKTVETKESKPDKKEASIKSEVVNKAHEHEIKKPIVNNYNKVEGLSVESIGKIIDMKKTLDNYDEKELEFVKSYFQKENDEAPEIIYSALTIERRGLDALNKIVVARNSSAAERAFYLMELDNNSIEAIHEQIDIIIGGLNDTPSVNSENKIQICRLLENAISNMSNDVFKFIDKLQEFTNIAIK